MVETYFKKHQIIVADVADKFILGVDLLMKFGATLDLKNSVLKVDDEKLLFHELQEDIVRVVLTKDFVLPSESETIVTDSTPGGI